MRRGRRRPASARTRASGVRSDPGSTTEGCGSRSTSGDSGRIRIGAGSRSTMIASSSSSSIGRERASPGPACRPGRRSGAGCSALGSSGQRLHGRGDGRTGDRTRVPRPAPSSRRTWSDGRIAADGREIWRPHQDVLASGHISRESTTAVVPMASSSTTASGRWWTASAWTSSTAVAASASTRKPSPSNTKRSSRRSNRTTLADDHADTRRLGRHVSLHGWSLLQRPLARSRVTAQAGRWLIWKRPVPPIRTVPFPTALTGSLQVQPGRDRRAP